MGLLRSLRSKSAPVGLPSDVLVEQQHNTQCLGLLLLLLIVLLLWAGYVLGCRTSYGTGRPACATCTAAAAASQSAVALAASFVPACAGLAVGLSKEGPA
jgi:hypothetical protein